MNIIIEENSSLNQSNSGLVTGEIYFVDNNNYFPEKGWSDFPTIILGWWMNSFLEFIKKNSNICEFCFMDGSFKVIGVVIKEEKIDIYFCSQYEHIDEKIYVGCIDRMEIRNMLLKACRKLFRVAVLSGISDDKLKGLRKEFNELKDLQL